MATNIIPYKNQIVISTNNDLQKLSASLLNHKGSLEHCRSYNLWLTIIKDIIKPMLRKVADSKKATNIIIPPKILK